MNDKIVNELVEFGMTKYEAKIYVKLVTRGPLSTSEISKLTRIPQTKIYEIVKQLGNKMIIEEACENGHKKFKAVCPNHAIKNIIERKENEIKDMKERGEKILNQIEENTVPFDDKKGFWFSEGRKNFLRRVSLMIKNADKYAYGITRDFSRISDLDEEIVNAVKRNVKVRLICIGDLKKLNYERAKWYSSNNVEIKSIKLKEQPRLCLVDGDEVCMRIDNTHNSEFLWSDNDAMTNLAKSYFDKLWNESKDVLEITTIV